MGGKRITISTLMDWQGNTNRVLYPLCNLTAILKIIYFNFVLSLSVFVCLSHILQIVTFTISLVLVSASCSSDPPF